MDSLTQIVLGAAVGEVVAGSRLGNKAILWGAVGGTIPDLDVLFGLFATDLQNLLWHRGVTHSILFALVIGPVMGWLLNQFYLRKEGPNRRLWTQLFFWAIFTHPLLDAFTNYGTQLFWPFWDLRVSFNTVSVVDPAYTVPLLIVIIWALFLKRERVLRQKLTWVGLGISSAYLLLGVVNKQLVNQVVEQNITELKLQVDDYMTVPTIGNGLLWSVILRDSTGYYAGYYSLLDEYDRLELIYLPRHDVWLEPYAGQRDVADLLAFTKGYYTLEQSKEGLIVNDLRFSPARGWFFPYDPYIFSFLLKAQNESILIERKIPYIRPKGEDIQRLLDRAKGN